MANATKEVKVIEIGDHAFLITCPLPTDVAELTRYPFFDANDAEWQWDRFIDRGDEGFEVQVNTHYWGGEGRNWDDVCAVLQYVWEKLHEHHAVPTSEMPEIIFGDNGPQSRFITGS